MQNVVKLPGALHSEFYLTRVGETERVYGHRGNREKGILMSSLFHSDVEVIVVEVILSLSSKTLLAIEN